MEFPPEDWPVFPANNFKLGVPRDPGALGIASSDWIDVNTLISDSRLWRGSPLYAGEAKPE